MTPPPKKKKSLSLGGVVYWSIHSTLALRARVRVSRSPRTFALQQDNLSTLLLLTVYGYPVGCDRLLCLNFPAPLSQAAIPGILPGEWKLCTVSAALKCIQWPGVIIIYCKRFGPYGKSAYKNQVLRLRNDIIIFALSLVHALHHARI